MEFYDVLEKRHSCRKFEAKEIDESTLKKILRAIMGSPSAGNLQAYKIYVVKNKEKKEGIARAALDQDFIAEAPVVLVFCADKKKSESKYGERGMQLYSLQDATIAASYSQLIAEAEGISSVWVGAFEPLEISYLVNAEPEEVPVAIIPLGYRAESIEESTRKPLSEMIKEV